MTRAQYLDEVTWTTKNWLGLQKQRISVVLHTAIAEQIVNMSSEPWLSGCQVLSGDLTSVGLSGSCQALSGASVRPHLLRLFDHKPVLDELAHVLPRVSHADLIHLVGVEPHLRRRGGGHASCRLRRIPVPLSTREPCCQSAAAPSPPRGGHRPHRTSRPAVPTRRTGRVRARGTLRLPHLSTDAASRFCSSSETPMTARSKSYASQGQAMGPAKKKNTVRAEACAPLPRPVPPRFI